MVLKELLLHSESPKEFVWVYKVLSEISSLLIIYFENPDLFF